MPPPRRQLLTAFLLALFIAATGTTALHAKRVAPPPVPPITLNGVQFTVDNSSPDTMGVVRATDIRTGKKLWEKKLYTVLMNPFLEQDVQWVFIKKMEAHWPTGSPSNGNATLRVTNERGQTYEIDPATGRSRKIGV